MRRTCFVVSCCSLLLSLTVFAPRGMAANIYWDGSASSSWVDVANWSTVIAGGTNPTLVPGSGDRVFFNATTLGNAITTLGAAQATQGLVFNTNASGGTTLGTLNDFVLTLGTQGIDVQSGTQVINSSLTLGGTQTWTAAAGTSLTVAGNVAFNNNLTLAGAGSLSLTGAITSTSTRTLTVSNTTGNVSVGNVSNTSTLTWAINNGATLNVNGILSGTGENRKDGAGTLIFNGANTFSGNLRILDGTVKVNTSTGSTSGGLVFGLVSGAQGLNGAGVLTLDTNSQVNFRLGNTLYVHPTSDGATINAGGGGSFVPTFGLYASRTFIINDTAADVDLMMDVGISNGDATARTLTKQSIGTMVMRGANTYTGDTNVERGSLILDYSLNNSDSRLSNTGAVNLRGGILELRGNATAATSETIGSLVLTRDFSTLALVSNGQAVTLNITGGITRGTGAGVVKFMLDNQTQIISTGGAGNNAYGILGGWATVNRSRWATKVGNEIVALTGTTQNDKSLWTAADHIIINGATTGVLGTNEVASLILDSTTGGTLTLNNAGGALTLGAGALLVSGNVGANATAITGGQLMTKQTAGGQSTEVIITNDTAGIFTLGANLVSSNTPQSLQTLNLTLTGSGLIHLTGSNNLFGHTSVASGSQTAQVNVQGLIRVSGGNGLPDFGTLTMSAGAGLSGGAMLDLNGGTEGIGNLSGGGSDSAYLETGRSEIYLGDTGGTLTINQTGNTSYTGLITGTDALIIKKGAGTLSLTSNNPHNLTGEVRVLGGLLDFTGGADALTTIDVLRIRGGQLRSEQNATDNSINKFNNTAALYLEGTSGDGYRVTSNQNGARTETVGSLNLAASANTLTLDNTATATDTAVTTLAFGAATNSFTRANGATMLVRGPNIGGVSSAAADATRVTFATPAAINSYLIGTSTTAGAKNLKVLAFAIGENSANGVNNPAGVGNTFLTVDSTAGNSLRTLTDSEYGNDYALADPDFNLSLNAGATGLASKTLNALRVVSSGGNVSLAGTAGSTLTLTSGGLLISAGATENDVVISGYDSIKAGTSAAGNDELVAHVTSSAAAASGATLTVQSAIVDNNGLTGGATSLTKTGAGTLILTGANTYTGETTVNQGVLEFGAAGTGNLGTGLVRISGGTLRWGAGNTTDITTGGRAVELLGASVYLTPNFGGYILGVGSVMDVGSNNVTLAGPVGNGGHGGLTKMGNGTLNLSSAPTYTGATVVSQGALNFQSIAPNTTEALYLIQTAGVTSGTISSTIQNGLNLQSLVVGGVYGTSANMAATVNVLGGAVNIGNGGGDDFILIGYRDPTALASSVTTPLANTTGTVNFSAASSVTINVAQIQMGIFNGGSGSPNTQQALGNLTLSSGTNSITASSIIMGSSPTSEVNSGTASTLNLGTGSTTINVDTFVIGGIRSKADVTIGGNGSFTLRGQQGGSTGANLYIGDNDATGTGTANNSSLNLTGASNVDMRLNLLVLGRLGGSTNNGYGRGTLTYAVGTILADTIRMAEANYTDAAGTNPQLTQGTITQSGTASMRFRQLSQGSGTATYNWQGGTIGNITDTNLTNQNVTVTLNGSGSATDASLRTFDVEEGQTATFEADAEIAGTGSYTKAGGGQLIYKGVNTQSGNVRIGAGSIALAATGSMDDAAWVNVESGASFDISQRTGAAYTTDAVISGNGTIGGTGATLTIGTNVGAVNSVGVLKPGGSSVLNSAANAATVGNQTGTLTVQGNLILAAAGGVRVDRAELQIGTTNRNAASTYATYGNATTWVDNIVTDFAAFMTGSGTGHDRLDIAGTLTLNNTGGIGVTLNGGYTGVFGDVFNLADWTGITNNGFTTGNRIRLGGEAGVDLALPTLAAGLAWDTSLFQTHGVIVVVPEPTRGVLLLLAGLAFVARRRRR